MSDLATDAMRYGRFNLAQPAGQLTPWPARSFVSIHTLSGTLYAMASDGTVWLHNGGEWVNLGGVPQPVVNDPPAAAQRNNEAILGALQDAVAKMPPPSPSELYGSPWDLAARIEQDENGGFRTQASVLQSPEGQALLRDLAAPPFRAFPKIPRYSRDAIVTEKIDGILGLVYISEDGQVFAGSKSRWLDPETKGGDNHGFGMWVFDRAHQLLSLGPGYHFGEFWGSGIQRGYGLQAGEKRWSLFNVSRWAMGGKDEATRPACCDVVPILWQGSFDDIDDGIGLALASLHEFGSAAARGFRNPEGIVIYHVAGNVLFKKTLAHDDKPKGQT